MDIFTRATPKIWNFEETILETEPMDIMCTIRRVGDTLEINDMSGGTWQIEVSSDDSDMSGGTLAPTFCDQCVGKTIARVMADGQRITIADGDRIVYQTPSVCLGDDCVVTLRALYENATQAGNQGT